MDFSKVKDCNNANEITRAYMDGLLIESRYIDSGIPDIKLDLYGKTFDSPIMISAFSHLGNWHSNGMVEMALGAKEANICDFVGMGDEEELSSILSTGANCIKIIKPYADRKVIYNRLKHAYENGALAVGMDIDHSFNNKGEADVVCELLMEPITMEELGDFVKATPLPFVVKGVLSVEDAKKCMEAGVSGIVISHHHGISPCSIPPLMILPKIREVVGEKMKIFVDCGIATGIDAFKALALGATGVCVSRAILDPFKEKGASGVEEYIGEMNQQLKSLMARTGSSDLSKMSADVIWNGHKE
ncbi:MAG: alpha-hydroxy acid oxidase [Eubacteriales bacterium]